MKRQKNLPNDVSAHDGSPDDPFLHEEEAEIPLPIALPIVVALGASAGGLDAFEAFFRVLPPDTNLAYVVLQHHDPNRVSHLADLIQRYTPIHVREARRSMMVEMNTITVFPQV